MATALRFDPGRHPRGVGGKFREGMHVSAARHFHVKMPHGYDPVTGDTHGFIRGQPVGIVHRVLDTDRFEVQTDAGRHTLRSTDIVPSGKTHTVMKVSGGFATIPVHMPQKVRNASAIVPTEREALQIANGTPAVPKSGRTTVAEHKGHRIERNPSGSFDVVGPDGQDISDNVSWGSVGAARDAIDKRTGGGLPAAPASPSGPASGTVHRVLRQVANGKSESMSRRRKQDLVSRGFAKWDEPGKISLTPEGQAKIGLPTAPESPGESPRSTLKWNQRRKRLEGEYRGVKMEKGAVYQFAHGSTITTARWDGTIDANKEPVFKHVDSGASRSAAGADSFERLDQIDTSKATADRLAGQEAAAKADRDSQRQHERVRDYARLDAARGVRRELSTPDYQKTYDAEHARLSAQSSEPTSGHAAMAKFDQLAKDHPLAAEYHSDMLRGELEDAHARATDVHPHLHGELDKAAAEAVKPTRRGDHVAVRNDDGSFEHGVVTTASASGVRVRTSEGDTYNHDHNEVVRLGRLKR